MGNIVLDSFLDLLSRFKAMDIRQTIDFEKWNEISITHHSTAIEGSSLTIDESRLLLSEKITAKGKPLSHHNMVIDHHDALMKTLAYAGQKEKITPELLKNISASVMKHTGGVVNTIAGSFDTSKGDFRLAMVYVGERYFMNYQKVPEAVKKLCDEITAKIDKLQSVEEIYNLAFDAHFSLVTIHPFGDGNGRVSRLLMNYVLAYHKQPLALLFTEDKADYFKALEDSRNQESYLPFRNFLYSQQTKFYEQEIQKINQETKWSFKP